MAGHLNRKWQTNQVRFRGGNIYVCAYNHIVYLSGKSIWAIISVDMLAVIIDRNDKTQNQSFNPNKLL